MVYTDTEELKTFLGTFDLSAVLSDKRGRIRFWFRYVANFAANASAK